MGTEVWLLQQLLDEISPRDQLKYSPAALLKSLSYKHGFHENI
jgi:hypothetical protein